MARTARIGKGGSGRPGRSAEQGGGDTETLTADDFTYLGAYSISPPGGGSNYYYSSGLTIRYEPSDVTNPVHLLSGAFYPDVAGPGGYIYEWRDQTPQTPLVSATTTPIKEYGNVWGSPVDVDNYKRLTILGEDVITFNQNAGNNPFTSVYYDPVDEVLYSVYGDSYYQQDVSYHIACTELNYSAGTGTPHGPWRMSSTNWKAGLSGMVPIPDSFRTAAGLGAKRLGVGFGGTTSAAASGDCGFGPSLTAVEPGFGATEQTALNSVALVGYYPVGVHFCNRPTGYEHIPNSVLALSGLGPGETPDPATAWVETDYAQGGVWIHGAAKSGFIAFGYLVRGQTAYINATLAGEYCTPMAHVYSEADLLEVALGTKERWEIQPNSFPWIIPTDVNYAVPAYESGGVVGTIANITSVAGFPKGQNTLASDPTGFDATVTTNGAHNRTTGDWVSIIGNTVPTEYDSLWEIHVLNSTQYKIRNKSLNSYVWAGTTGTGGNVNLPAISQLGPWPGYGYRTWGAAFDPNTNKLYMGITHPGTNFLSGNDDYGMIAVWSVNCD